MGCNRDRKIVIVKIDDLRETLRDLYPNSVLVIGEPGVGKSMSIIDFAKIDMVKVMLADYYSSHPSEIMKFLKTHKETKNMLDSKINKIKYMCKENNYTNNKEKDNTNNKEPNNINNEKINKEICEIMLDDNVPDYIKYSNVITHKDIILNFNEHNDYVVDLTDNKQIEKYKNASADELKTKVIFKDIRLSEYLPEDLIGFPKIDNDTAKEVPFAWVKIFTKANYGLLFIDEITNEVRPELQSAVYKIVYDKIIGENKLPDKVMVVGAGNDPLSSSEIARGLPSALINRFNVFRVETPSIESWYNYTYNKLISKYYNVNKDDNLISIISFGNIPKYKINNVDSRAIKLVNEIMQIIQLYLEGGETIKFNAEPSNLINYSSEIRPFQSPRAWTQLAEELVNYILRTTKYNNLRDMIVPENISSNIEELNDKLKKYVNGEISENDIMAEMNKFFNIMKEEYDKELTAETYSENIEKITNIVCSKIGYNIGLDFVSSIKYRYSVPDTDIILKNIDKFKFIIKEYSSNMLYSNIVNQIIIKITNSIINNTISYINTEGNTIVKTMKIMCNTFKNEEYYNFVKLVLSNYNKNIQDELDKKCSDDNISKECIELINDMSYNALFNMLTNRINISISSLVVGEYDNNTTEVENIKRYIIKSLSLMANNIDKFNRSCKKYVKK